MMTCSRERCATSRKTSHERETVAPGGSLGGGWYQKPGRLPSRQYAPSDSASRASTLRHTDEAGMSTDEKKKGVNDRYDLKKNGGYTLASILTRAIEKAHREREACRTHVITQIQALRAECES